MNASNPNQPKAWVDRVAERMEALLFNHRKPWLIFFAVSTVFFLVQAALIKPDASLQKMIPAKHEFVQNYLKYEYELRPLGNTVRIAVEAKEGTDIYTADYINLLKEISEEVFFVPGVDRGNLKSLWTPNTLWFEAAEDGLRSGKVIPKNFTGTPEQVEELRENILKARLIGMLVADDQKSTVIMAPLVESDPDTGEKLDYGKFSRNLEERIRDKYEPQGVKIRIVGFAKLIGDLIAGAEAIAGFFVITVLLTSALLYLYCRCWKSTAVTIACCLLAVVWHMGFMRMLGFGLDPYSILVPFMTFAIGVSHAVQNINTLASAIREGADKITAARATFGQLFVPGTIALLCDVVGFSTLLVIDIGVIRELALSASIGVFVIIFTKMFLLPVLMSYFGLSKGGLDHAIKRHNSKRRFAELLASLAEGRRALMVVGVSAVLFVVAFVISRGLQIGDLDPGAPEFRSTARYNQDVAYFNDRYSTSSDVYVVMVKTPVSECNSYAASSTARRLQVTLEELPVVQGTISMFNVTDLIVTGFQGGNLKWATATRNKFISNSAHRSVPSALYNNDCSMFPIIVYLSDHKADTLTLVSQTVDDFRKAEPEGDIEILRAAGNSGIDAATNDVVRAAWLPMLFLVYGIVALLLMLEFRSWKVTLCILIPLIITSILCEAIMTVMGLGVKVATLPVIALGVGIGVDYGIYLYNRLGQFLDEGLSLRDAYFETMKTTGMAVAFTGITLAAGVLTWIFSSIKFQADMGLLLTFMFLWNMLGAIVLIPALAGLMGLGQKKDTQASS